MKKNNKLNIFELVLISVLAVALGVAFWGWTFVYEFTSPFLKAFGLKYLFAGFWLMSAILPPYIVRKPGVAIMSSTLAAIVEGLITNWGLMAAVWGFVQGLGVELIFILFLYRRWEWPIIILSSIFAATFSYALDFFYYNYQTLSLKINFIQLLSFIVSSIILAAISSIVISKRLARSGILNNFNIVKQLNN
ncbi:MAG: ECF transporter S component [Oligoflexia bacterium]|nr:ECF transporter S component [Oligoflexia bacterium]